VSRPGVSELQSEDLQFLVRNGRLLRSSIVLKTRDSFRKLVSSFADQLLLQSVEKCNAVFCREGL
jgi:hypothetical protein